MKKFLRYEFKKHLWPILIVTLCCALPCLLFAALNPMVEEGVRHWNGELYRRVYSPGTWLPLIELLALAYGVPVAVYSFKMKKRSVDCYYALPIKKEKLYFIKTLVGLSLMLVPFTAAFWGMVFVTAIRPENPYVMGWFVPQYFALLGFGICLYGFNAFVFTRANAWGDGIVFVFAYTFVAVLAIGTGLMAIDATSDVLDMHFMEYLMPPVGSIVFNINMEALCMGEKVIEEWNVCMFLLPTLYGLIGYFFLFFNLRFDKGENAEQVSDSWFGYRVLIPIYTACCLGLCGGIDEFLLFAFFFVVITVSAFVVTMIYRRKFLFPVKNLIIIGVGLGVGLVLAIVIAIVHN